MASPPLLFKSNPHFPFLDKQGVSPWQPEESYQAVEAFAKHLQAQAAKGRLGDAVIEALNRYPADAEDFESVFHRGLLASPAMFWTKGKKGFACLITALAEEGHEDALRRLKDEGITAVLPYRSPHSMKLTDPKNRWWAPLERWLEREAAKKVDAVPRFDEDGDRILPWTHRWKWDPADQARQLRMLALLQDDRLSNEDRTKPLPFLYGDTPLDTAASRHMNHLIPALIAAGAPLDVPGSLMGALPLHEALLRGNLEGAQLLLNAGADINARTGDFVDINEDDLEVENIKATAVEFIFSIGVERSDFVLFAVEADRQFFLEKTLPWLTLRGGLLPPELLGAGVAMSSVTEVVVSDPVMVKALIQYGLDVNGLNLTGESLNTPLSYTLKDVNGAESALVLLESGADVFAITEDGNTVLHVAASSGASPALLQTLIKAGLDPFALNAKGETPLACAVSADQTETIRFLSALAHEKELRGSVNVSVSEPGRPRSRM